MKIRTVGANPFAADTVGVDVNLTRTLCLVAGGAIVFGGTRGRFRRDGPVRHRRRP